MATREAASEVTEVTEVFVISDGTGETCAAAVRAAMLQFDDRWHLRIFGGIRHASEIRRVVGQAAEIKALVVFSLVEGKIVTALQHEAERLGVTTVDLLGPLIAKVAVRLRAEPRHQPGLLHGYTDDYFKRVEAVEFAVRHDDGANLHTLAGADIVVTGVSRTSKTPLSMYLAQRGYKTGNVPLVPGVEPPRVLLEMDRRKVFGLIIDPSTLRPMRVERVRAIGSRDYSSSYTEPEAMQTELEESRRLFRRQGWRIIDISGRAMEENASRIVDLYRMDSEPPDRDER
jgi:regulator of PEP synthase PpsR (kinase-PPPase family)